MVVRQNQKLLERLKEVKGLNSLGQYERALDVCEEILGDHRSPNRLFHYFFREDCPTILKHQEFLAEHALYLKFETLVDLIEQRPNGSDYVSEIASLADQVLRSQINDKDVLVMCAEGYMLAFQNKKAEVLLWSLLDLYPGDVKVAAILLIVLGNSDNEQGVEWLAKLILPQHGQSDDLDSKMICARAAFATKNWQAAIHSAKQALAHRPSDPHLLKLHVSLF